MAVSVPAALVPPQNLEAEESVLGAMLLSPTAVGRNLSSIQASRAAGSTLWPNIAPGSDSTPSLTTITSISPTRSA